MVHPASGLHNDFLDQVDAWLPAGIERVYAILDNLSEHRATHVLLFALAHQRWEFVYHPKYAAYLNPIEPCWKILRSPVLEGRRRPGVPSGIDLPDEPPKRPERPFFVFVG